MNYRINTIVNANVVNSWVEQIIDLLYNYDYVKEIKQGERHIDIHLYITE